MAALPSQKSRKGMLFVKLLTIPPIFHHNKNILYQKYMPVVLNRKCTSQMLRLILQDRI